MPIFSDKGAEHSQNKKKFWQKTILFIGAGSFLGTALIPIVGGIAGSFNQSATEEAAVTEQSVLLEQIQQREAGFEEVLSREPNNPNALQGLTQARLELGDLEGAIAPLDQLIELFPEDEVLQDLRAQIGENLARQNGGAVTPEPAESQLSPTTPPTTTEPEPEPAISPLEQPTPTDSPEAP